MFGTILFASFIIAAFFWGDWRNWARYYSTILYFIINSLIYSVIFHSYPLWEFHPLFSTKNILPNNTLTALTITLVIYPATVLIYLGNYPKGKTRFLYIGLWVLIYSVIEYLAFLQGIIDYHNGWKYIYSVFFNVILFSGLTLHHKKPLYGWIIAAIFGFAIPILFKLPIETMK